MVTRTEFIVAMDGFKCEESKPQTRSGFCNRKAAYSFVSNGRMICRKCAEDYYAPYIVVD